MGAPDLNWRFILKILGFTLVVESFFLFCAAGISFYYHEWDIPYILTSAAICLCCGSLLALMGDMRERMRTIGKQESFLTVTLSWLLLTVFGSMPFYFSGAIPSMTDAFFETMSGLTTTGATILTDIERMPKGLLFWRSIIQWLGGVGVIVFSLALLPLLGGEAAQLFDAETSGLTHDKFRPRVGQVAKRIWGIYVGFTVIVLILLWAGPMDFFDALCHALTTISTGGFSTKQASVAYWDSFYIEGVMVIFMIIGSINFALYYFLFKGNFKRFYKDEELHWFLAVIVGSTLLITVALYNDNPLLSSMESFRSSLFHVVSLITSTGFSTCDYLPWGTFYWIALQFLMVICGCAGSTSGGFKMVRVVVLVKNTINEFGRLIHPRAIIPVRLNKTALSVEVVQRLLAFSFLFMILILTSWLILSFCGMSYEEALAAAITAISNVGPGLGTHGPAGSFANIPDFAKWYMAILMLIGRLEVFTVLVLFTPGFWKK